jgi:hypothetical protein
MVFQCGEELMTEKGVAVTDECIPVRSGYRIELISYPDLHA